MNISVTLPVEYACGSMIDMSRYGFVGIGMVIDSFRGQSNVDVEVPGPDDSPVDRIFFLARQVFGATKEDILSERRFERLLYPRIAITHALLRHGDMKHEDIRKVMRKERCSIYHYEKRYECVEFMERSMREKMYEFDRQAKQILTDYRHGATR